MYNLAEKIQDRIINELCKGISELVNQKIEEFRNYLNQNNNKTNGLTAS